MLTNCLATCTHLSSTVSQVFEPQVCVHRPEDPYPFWRPKFFRCRPPDLEQLAASTATARHWASVDHWRHFCLLRDSRDGGALVTVLVAPCISSSYYYLLLLSAKNRHFHVPQPTLLFPLDTPLHLSRNILHGWKDNSMLAKPLAACTYLSSIVSKLYDA